MFWVIFFLIIFKMQYDSLQIKHTLNTLFYCFEGLRVLGEDIGFWVEIRKLIIYSFGDFVCRV